MITVPVLDFLDAEHKETTKSIEFYEEKIKDLRSKRRDLSKAIDALVFKSTVDSAVEGAALGGGVLGGYAAKATEGLKATKSNKQIAIEVLQDLRMVRGTEGYNVKEISSIIKQLKETAL